MKRRGLADTQLENRLSDSAGQFDAWKPQAGFRDFLKHFFPEWGDCFFMNSGQFCATRQKAPAVQVQCTNMALFCQP